VLLLLLLLLLLLNAGTGLLVPASLALGGFVARAV